MHEPEPVDPDPLPDGSRFSFLRRADGSLLVCYGAAPIILLRGRAAARLVAADDELAQRLMARAASTAARGAGGRTEAVRPRRSRAPGS